jgi:hypothetical protein
LGVLLWEAHKKRWRIPARFFFNAGKAAATVMAFQLFYSPRCPYSMELGTLLEESAIACEFLNVDDMHQVPTWLPGTPALICGTDVFCGDAAFDRVEEQLARAAPPPRAGAALAASSGGGAMAHRRMVPDMDCRTPQPVISQQTAAPAGAAGSGMIEARLGGGRSGGGSKKASRGTGLGAAFSSPSVADEDNLDSKYSKEAMAAKLKALQSVHHR